MEILKSFLLEIGKNARRLAEHGSRQKIIADDVIVALCSLGVNVSEIPSFYWSIQQKNAVSGTQVVTIKAPEVSCSAEPESKRLKVGHSLEKVCSLSPEFFHRISGTVIFVVRCYIRTFPRGTVQDYKNVLEISQKR